MAQWDCGIDVGGTFTDLIGINADGRVTIAKVPSTPPNFELGMVEAIKATEIPDEEWRLFFHGTTVATNTVINKTGAQTGLITTKGFRDVLELRRANRGVLYDLMWDPPEPLVPRELRIGVTERVSAAGELVEPLDEDEAREAVRELKRRGVEAIAVCFLNCFANSVNEDRMKEIVRAEFPEAYLSVASEVLPQPPEFERTATVVANAYVGPPTSSYLSRVTNAARDLGYENEVLVMHSGGGVLGAGTATDIPVRLANSGPAAGVMAAAAIGRATGRRNVVSFDMGGTSTDIALILEGEPRVRTEFEIEWGVPVIFPSIDIIAIGAGGGSIAWIDNAGYPKSGPQSAGADPGPACYGRGGEDPTNTDANLLLGRLDADRFLGGQMKVDPGLSEKAVKEKIADRLGIGTPEAAAGIIKISNNNMAAALRLVTVQRGFDPRELSLVAFGGAGPLHAVEVARELGIPEVIVPAMPGITSALGLMFSDVLHDVSHAHVGPVEGIDFDDMNKRFERLQTEAVDWLQREQHVEGGVTLTRSIDFRYAGQMRSITVPISSSEAFDQAMLDGALELFHKEHEREFGYARRAFAVETAVLRVSAVGSTTAPDLQALTGISRGDASNGAGKNPTVEQVYFEPDGYQETAVYSRPALSPGDSFEGPAVVRGMDSTVVLPPGSRGKVDNYLNILIEVQA